MYEHIGRLAILHISNVTFICTRERRKRNVAISGFPGLKKDLRVTVSPVQLFLWLLDLGHAVAIVLIILLRPGI